MGDNRDASDAILEDAIFLFSVCEYCGPVAIVLIGCLACLSLFQNKVVTEWRVLILERERKIKVFRTLILPFKTSKRDMGGNSTRWLD